VRLKESVACPHCGHPITVLLTATPPPGQAQPNAIVESTAAQPAAMSGVDSTQSGATDSSNGEIAYGSKTLTKDGRQTYNLDYPADFQVFWSIYPLHRDKRKALKAWRNAIRRAATDVINAGATRYRNDPHRDPSYTKYAEGWLNGDGWEDEPLPPRGQSRFPLSRPDPPRALIGDEGMDQIREALYGND